MLKQQLQNDLKAAVQAHDAIKVATLRLLLAAIANKEIALRKKEEGISGEEAHAVVRSEVKKRKEAAAAFAAAGRAEQAAREEAEGGILQGYLPEELSDAALRELVSETIRKGAFDGPAALGKAMKEIMSRVAGRASGERVRAMVQHVLGA